MRRCVAEEIGRRLGAREVTETPEFIGLDEFSVSPVGVNPVSVPSGVSGRRLYHTAICNLVKGEVMEVVEGQGRQKVEEYLGQEALHYRTRPASSTTTTATTTSSSA